MSSLAQKYEPKTLADMVIHDPKNVIMPLLTKVSAGKISPNLFLYGNNGSGKTTLAKVLTADFYKAYGEEDITQFVEMANQTDDRQYGTDKISFHWSRSGSTWHIFDEVEKCPNKNVNNVLHHTLDNKSGHRYILTANSLASIPNGIISRAQPVPVDCPTPDEFLTRAKFILMQENVHVADEKILAVLNAVPRDMRRYYAALELL